MTGARTGERPLVFVTVGTDHHPFDRLIQWVDTWLEQRGDGEVDCVIQSGTSARPTRTESTDYLDAEAMAGLMDKANVVVCHGGPGTIMLASSRGTRCG